MLLAAGYTVYAVNPRATSRYRDRHTAAGAKSDRGDAKVLADMVRTDRHNHRPLTGDSDLAEAIQVLARAHKHLIWLRQQEVGHLRNALHEYYPAILKAFPGLTLSLEEALEVLRQAPTPEAGRRLDVAEIRDALARAGRKRSLDARALHVQEVLRSPQLEQPRLLAKAFGGTAAASASVISALSRQIAGLEQQLREAFEAHPDAEILHSLPGLGVVLGARVLGEFGDQPNRFADGKARKNYAATSPVTRMSGTKRAVGMRYACNKWLQDACIRWAFCSLQLSPGARRQYDQLREGGKSHYAALRCVANRWVGILHGCLRYRCLYAEDVAWPTPASVAA